jgi:predicted amidophosphoribosyltransferase
MAHEGTKICSACGQPAGRRGDPPQIEAGETAHAPHPVCRNVWCSRPDRPLRSVYWVGAYEGALRAAIFAYKYRGDLRWARPFANMLFGFLNHHAIWFEEFHVICPVPSFRGPTARREFGHVELLCAELAFLAGGTWPVELLVTKTAETEPMSAKAHTARRRIGRTSLSAALSVVDERQVEARRVLIVDDVCTSGETLLAVAGALRDAGADEVSALVLARAYWHRPQKARTSMA